MIDWLAASFDLLSLLQARGLADDVSAILDDLNGPVGACAPAVASALADHFFPDLFALGDPSRGRFYNWRVALRSGDNHVGLLEFGGINTIRQDGTVTARLELTGDGCRLYEASSGSDHAQRWSLLASLLGALDARLTRVDIAADDFTGQYPVQWAIDRYNDGAFDKRGQRPKARLIDDMGNRTGKTFYVGSRKSEQQLRVYEKGREQGDPESPWVRYEGEFHASNRRELLLDMLIDPAPYLIGAYPVLDFVGGIGERLRIATEKLVANCKRAVIHFRRQYGPMLNAMLHAAGGDEATLARLVLGTARQALPAWCPRPDDAAQLLTAILFAPVGHIEGQKGQE
ncbi:replication initiation factor domain-containing protein [Pseudoxanthomonas sp.]|uniref:replication initiation factor domain-containing protein n=1 Tax=Pseudoxanthomonas sp. TaxID=1871049 RepID=UPI002583B0E2|nr:replication initiation factor domain-containing protein [Pseudoxanthomonas sp.]MCR6687090.1 replication initiation factor domain-containing protein [Pseudoxanthomonas sp.]